MQIPMRRWDMLDQMIPTKKDSQQNCKKNFKLSTENLEELFGYHSLACLNLLLIEMINKSNRNIPNYITAKNSHIFKPLFADDSPKQLPIEDPPASRTLDHRFSGARAISSKKTSKPN